MPHRALSLQQRQQCQVPSQVESKCLALSDIERRWKKNVEQQSAPESCNFVWLKLSRNRKSSCRSAPSNFTNDQKGYGFIAPEDGSKDVFVHVTALERAGMQGLSEGQKVSFDTAADNRSGKVSVNNIKAG